MSDFPSLLDRLIRERGMTRLELATAIGKTLDTVGKVVQGRGSWPASTAAKAFHVLNQIRMKEEDAHTFLDHFGLSHSLYDAAPAPPSAQAPRVVSTRENTAQLFSTAVRLLGELIELRGPEGAAEILRRAIDEAKASPERPQRYEVIHPPQVSRVPGAVEQTIVGYEPPKKSAAAIKRARKA